MPVTTTNPDIDLIIEDIGGGAGGGKPPARGDDGDNSSGGSGRGDGGKRRTPPIPSSRRYYTGVAIAIVSVLMFFMTLASAFLVRRGTSSDWIPVRLPPILFVNTVILLLSSATLERARRKLAQTEAVAFRTFWSVTTALGFLFLVGQVIAWRQLVAAGVYIASNPASSFFYIFTGLHALHLLGGVAALLFVARHDFARSKISRAGAAEVASHYWHFMDALWIFLLLLMILGK